MKILYNRVPGEETRFRDAEWDNCLRHGPVGSISLRIRALHLRDAGAPRV